MLAALGFITVIAMLILIMTKKASPAVALIIVPLITGIIACAFIVTDPEGAPGVVNFAANVKSLGGMIAGDDGLLSVAATGVMFIFSILFFGILTDAGTFRPIIGGITKLVGTNPILIAIGTSILAMIVHLDGSGAVTFLICVPPLVPLYDAVGMKRTTLATIVAMSAGTMNILPWGGPTIRAATALNVDVVSELFMPVLPAVLVGLALDVVLSALLGAREKARLGTVKLTSAEFKMAELTEEEKKLARPHLFWVNIILIIAAIVTLLFSGFAPAVVFMIFYVLATVINYPKVADTKARVDANAKSAIMMCSVLFAAGAFCGIMTGTGMITEILGQMTVGFPVSPLTPSTFLLVGLAGVDLGEHQKKTIPILWLVSLVMLVVAVLTGGITI